MKSSFEEQENTFWQKDSFEDACNFFNERCGSFFDEPGLASK
jgi:hypothetical protein